NTILLNTYWEIGRLIVEDEQKGKAKAAYGKSVLKMLSQQLTQAFGKGYDETNLRNIRQFYLAFPIRDALRHELSWTHYRLISRIDNQSLRMQYVQHAIDAGWDTRMLQRNISTRYIGRIIKPTKPGTPVTPTAQSMVKDTYVFEFLGIRSSLSISESK